MQRQSIESNFRNLVALRFPPERCSALLRSAAATMPKKGAIRKSSRTRAAPQRLIPDSDLPSNIQQVDGHPHPIPGAPPSLLTC